MRFTTNSYKTWRSESQAIFDFAVLVSYAIPALKMQISLCEKGVIETLPRPDYYRSNKPGYYSSSDLRESLKRRSSEYKQQSASYMLISLFSHFEAYVVDIIGELFDFHGGPEIFLKIYNERVKAGFSVSDENLHLRRRITGVRKSYNVKYYKEVSGELRGKGMMFPSELLSGYGIRMLHRKLGDLRAKEIPDLLNECFHLDFSNQEIKDYHGLRDLRNSIAHGRKVKIDIKSVTDRNKILIRMAKKIDAQLGKYFFLFNDYV